MCGRCQIMSPMPGKSWTTNTRWWDVLSAWPSTPSTARLDTAALRGLHDRLCRNGQPLVAEQAVAHFVLGRHAEGRYVKTRPGETVREIQPIEAPVILTAKMGVTLLG